MIYRQGDVLLRSIDSIPADAKICRSKATRFVLAEGEATGHSHTICELDGTLSITPDGKLYLRTDDGCELLHQEHGAIAVAPGRYEVIRQREYSPEEIRNVAD